MRFTRAVDRRAGATILAVALCLTTSGQAAGDDPAAILALARAARGAYAADAILRLIPRIEKADVAGVIEEAFVYAEEAKDRYPITSTAPTDTLEAKQAQASVLQLDRLTLRARATKAMIAVDPPKARALFDRIEIGPFDSDCRGYRVYDLRQYYEAAAGIVNAMSKDQRANGDDLLFALRIIGDVRSPWQVESATVFIIRARLDFAKTTSLFTAFAGQLRDGDVVDPTGYVGLARRVQTLTGVLDKVAGVREILLPAIYEYTKRQAAYRRCSNTQAPRVDKVTIEGINRLLCRTGRERCLYTLDEKHFRPMSLATRPPLQKLWQSADSRQAKRLWEGLIYTDQTDNGRKTERTDTKSDEWAALFRAFMNALESWHGAPDDLAAALERLSLLERLVPKIPTSEQRLEAMRQYVVGLEALEAHAGKSQLWFLYAKAAVRLGKLLGPGDREHVDATLENDPVLKLYSMLSESSEVR